MAKYITILLIFLFSQSCESPWGLDTPRNIILPKPIDSVPLSLISIFVETNGAEEQFNLEKAMLEIDTVSKTQLVWGLITILSSVATNPETTKLGLYSIDLNLNNIEVGGKPITLNASSTPGSYATYKIHRSTTPNPAYDTTIVSDGTKNKTDITFSQDKAKRELWIYLDAMIFNNRFDKDSSGKMIYIPDSLFIKTRLNFNY